MGQGQDDGRLSSTIAGAATMQLANIQESEFLYTPIEERFERITRLARRALRVPVAAVTLLGPDKQWFKSVSGWTKNELPREQSLCRFTVEAGALTIIGDATKDPRTAANPLITSSPKFRSYAGYPLRDQDKATIGTFCVFDVKPRNLSSADRQCMVDLAALAQREMVSDRLRDAHMALTSKLGSARREAMIDPLTRLWNRRGAQVLLRAACEEADGKGTSIAVALLDVDRFKRINDTYGHQVGDEVMRRIASRVLGSVSEDDIVCRIGGDEILVVLPDTDTSSAPRITERVRRAVTDTEIPTRQGPIPMSISIGYTIRTPREAIEADQLIERADQGLLRAKSAGRNRTHRGG